MKPLLVQIDEAGRIVLPKNLCDELSINPGDFLRVSVQANHLTLCLDRRKATFVKRGRALIFSTGETDLLDHETVEAVHNQERDRLSVGMAKGFPQPKRK